MRVTTLCSLIAHTTNLNVQYACIKHGSYNGLLPPMITIGLSRHSK